MDYSVHFEIDNQSLLGDPIFCRFVIHNTGSHMFAFRYRTPTRGLGTDYEQEPRFEVTDSAGRRLSDPGPRPCGSPQGTAVYGYVTLPPGQTHRERWLLNQWGRFTAPGDYHVHAERRLALFPAEGQAGKFSDKPAAFALAIDDLNFQVQRASPAQVEAAYRPYLEAVANPKDPNPAEAVMVLTSMPQPFFLDLLEAMAAPVKPERWNRRDAVDGLARLDTPASWRAILKLFQGSQTGPAPTNKPAAADDPVASYALLLLAEKGNPTFLPTLLDVQSKSADPLRGDILRALGFFTEPRAAERLFENLHSNRINDRMNALLGLKNLGSREVIPALLAALNDPQAQVRQVANFALEGLTHYHVAVSADASQQDWHRVMSEWHAWWQAHAATFSPPRPAACHDW